MENNNNTNIERAPMKLYTYPAQSIQEALNIIDKEMKPNGIEVIRAVAYLIEILTHPYNELNEKDIDNLKSNPTKEIEIADKAEVSE
jgi:hypothetical protein